MRFRYSVKKIDRIRIAVIGFVLALFASSCHNSVPCAVYRYDPVPVEIVKKN